MRKKVVDNILYHVISIFMSFLGRLPEVAGNIAGDFIGSAWFAFDKKHRKISCANIKNAYGIEKSDTQIKILARKVFKNTARMLFEHTRFHRMNPEKFSDQFVIKGLDNLKNAHAQGRGVLCYSGHLGNWELLSVLTYIIKIKFSVVYKTVKFKPMERYITKKREFAGCHMIPVHNALDKVKISLKKGEAVGLIVDQDIWKGNRGVFIDFFDRKASVHKGLARLAMATKAPVVPVFTYRHKGKFNLEVLPEVPLIQTGDEQKDIMENTQAYHSIIEKYVRKYPEQWFWLHNKWKTRPLEAL